MNELRAFIKSIGHSWRGVLYVLRSERNARIHLVVALAVLVAAVVLGVSNEGLAALFFAIILVFLAEIMNTAFEKTLDLIDERTHPQIKLVKDMAAGAVLVTAFGAAAIGIAVLFPYLTGWRWR